MSNANTFTFTETDMSLRLVELWYDITWAYYMDDAVDHVANRLDKRRKTLSSSASVASCTSLAGDRSVMGKSMEEKLCVLERKLQQVNPTMTTRIFENIANVSMKSNDDVYPGFKDILNIAKYLLLYGDAYQNLLTSDEINHILTLPFVFQCIYYQLCHFLLHTPTGRHAMKLIIAPSKITHATYNICRQKFCELLYEETSIVHDGLLLLVQSIQENRVPSTSTTSTMPQGRRDTIRNDDDTVKSKTFPTIDLSASSESESESESEEESDDGSYDSDLS